MSPAPVASTGTTAVAASCRTSPDGVRAQGTVGAVLDHDHAGRARPARAAAPSGSVGRSPVSRPARASTSARLGSSRSRCGSTSVDAGPTAPPGRSWCPATWSDRGRGPRPAARAGRVRARSAGSTTRRARAGPRRAPPGRAPPGPGTRDSRGIAPGWVRIARSSGADSTTVMPVERVGVADQGRGVDAAGREQPLHQVAEGVRAGRGDQPRRPTQPGQPVARGSPRSRR